ncbi:MAG: efflux RND transporter periplasmic adaptor subunit [Candidatus Ozemobacteraceae bacterium]
MNIKRIFVVVLLLIVFCAAIFHVFKMSAETAKIKPAFPVPVTTLTVAPSENSRGWRFVGTFESEVYVELAFKLTGYVRELCRVSDSNGGTRALQGGDVVSSGTILAHVRDEEYQSRLLQASAGVGEAKAALEMARAQVFGAKASLDQAKSDYERAQRLFKTESLTKVELDGAKAKYEVAKSSMQSAEAQVLSLSAKTSGAQDARQEVQTVVRDTLLRAPFSGLLLKRNVEEGTLVSAGTVGFSLADVSRMKFIFGIPDKLLGQVTMGMSLTATLEAYPGKLFPGRVTRISPMADSNTRLFDVELSIPNEEGLLKPGMIGSIRLEETSHREVVGSLPFEAIVRLNPTSNAFGVLVVASEQGKTIARMKEIKLGLPDGNQVEIISGIKEGDRVVVDGAAFISDGEAITIVEPSS